MSQDVVKVRVDDVVPIDEAKQGLVGDLERGSACSVEEQQLHNQTNQGKMQSKLRPWQAAQLWQANPKSPVCTLPYWPLHIVPPSHVLQMTYKFHSLVPLCMASDATLLLKVRL